MSTWTDKYDSWKAKKSDLWLVDAVKTGDSTEKEVAAKILYENLQPKLESYLAKKLPSDWVENIAQETWTAFYDYVRVHEVNKGVANLLMTIARNKRADAVRDVTVERMTEAGEPLESAFPSDNRKQYDQDMEEELINLIPNAFLFGCQRIFWSLQMLGISPHIIARLTGKREGNIYESMRLAKEKVKQYLHSMEYDLWLANQELKNRLFETYNNSNPGLAIERFQEPFAPQLTFEELKPLGLTTGKFQSEFSVSLAVAGHDLKETVQLLGDNERSTLENRENPTPLQVQAKELYLCLERKEEWNWSNEWFRVEQLRRKWGVNVKYLFIEEMTERDGREIIECNHVTVDSGVGFTFCKVDIDDDKNIILTELGDLIFQFAGDHNFSQTNQIIRVFSHLNKLNLSFKTGDFYVSKNTADPPPPPRTRGGLVSGFIPKAYFQAAIVRIDGSVDYYDHIANMATTHFDNGRGNVTTRIANPKLIRRDESHRTV